MLKVKAFGLALGIIWALAVVWSIILAMMGKGLAPFNFINQFYLGWLSPTVGGLIIGIIIGFIDGSIAGMIFAWLYNKFAK